MLTAELPQPLQEEFERTARLLHDKHDNNNHGNNNHDNNSVQQALIEAVELWLAQQHQKLTEAEALLNNQIYEMLKSELEQKYPGQWIVIANGKLCGIADTPEAMNDLAPTARHRIVMQMGQTRPREVELGWQMTFA